MKCAAAQDFADPALFLWCDVILVPAGEYAATVMHDVVEMDNTGESRRTRRGTVISLRRLHADILETNTLAQGQPCQLAMGIAA